MGFCLFNNAAIAARHAQRAHGARPRRDRRLGRPPRQRHAGDRLDRPDHPLLLDPPDAALSRHRRRVGDRRRQHRQRAAPARRRRRRVPRRLQRAHPAGARPPSRPTSSSSRPASTPTGATRSPTLNLTEDDFAWATARAAWRSPTAIASGRIVSLLEGGYDLEALADSVAAHVADADDGMRLRSDRWLKTNPTRSRRASPSRRRWPSSSRSSTGSSAATCRSPSRSRSTSAATP